MSARLIHRNREVLTEVLYFSAVAAHLSDSEITKQRTFLTHLEASGVAIELGRFAKRQRQCSNCNRQYTVFEEKETDVAIATALLRIAFMQSAEKILLFSADTDLLPAIKMARAVNPELEIILVSTPPFLRASYGRMVNFVDGQIQLSKALIDQYQFGA